MVSNLKGFQNIREVERCGFGAKSFLLADELASINRYLCLLRKEEWFFNSSHFILRILRIFVTRKKNRMGIKLGFLIPKNVAEEGLKIWHCGCVVINAQAQIGRNCVLHGNNYIGNNGSDKGAPKIGNNVEIGFGAQVIGNVFIADGCTIGAGAVVTKSCYTPNATLVGVPAKALEDERSNSVRAFFRIIRINCMNPI